MYAYGNPEAATAPKKVSLLSLLQLLSPAKAKSADFLASNSSLLLPSDCSLLADLRGILRDHAQKHTDQYKRAYYYQILILIGNMPHTAGALYRRS